MDASNLSTHIRSPETIEKRIAASLRDYGRFHEMIPAGDLAIIMESVVSNHFSEQKVGGFVVGIFQTVTAMEVHNYD
jgi:hypothetical protein